MEPIEYTNSKYIEWKQGVSEYFTNETELPIEELESYLLEHMSTDGTGTIFHLDEQKKMLEKMIYPSDSNPFLHYIDSVYGRIDIQTIIEKGNYDIDDKEMLNNLRKQYVQYWKE